MYKHGIIDNFFGNVFCKSINLFNNPMYLQSILFFFSINIQFMFFVLNYNKLLDNSNFKV